MMIPQDTIHQAEVTLKMPEYEPLEILRYWNWCTQHDAIIERNDARVRVKEAGDPVALVGTRKLYNNGTP